MKKVLFIGDLRTAFNYGAIATTETLIQLIENEHYNIDIRYIDYRSFYNPTPLNGYASITVHPSTFRKKISKLLPANFKKRIKRILGFTSVKRIDFIPYKCNQYESYFHSMMSGQSLQFEKKMLEWSDIVYINGEGNIVNGTDEQGKYRMGARYILFMAWVSKVKFNKPTLMVNHTVDPKNANAFEMISQIYPLLDKVYVRETLSQSLLKKHCINATFIPDALWAYQPPFHIDFPEKIKKEINFSQPYICIGDSSGFKNNYNKVKWNVTTVLGDIIDELQKIIPQIIFVDGYAGGNEEINKLIQKKHLGCVSLYNCSYHELYYVLKNASLFISGRWHASILSVLANTPILLWGSDSHKTKSLYALLDYPYPFFEISTLPVNIDELIVSVKRILNDSESIKERLQIKCHEFAISARENAKIIKQYVE